MLHAKKHVPVLSATDIGPRATKAPELQAYYFIPGMAVQVRNHSTLLDIAREDLHSAFVVRRSRAAVYLGTVFLAP